MKVLVAPVLAVLTAVGLGLLLRSQDPRSEPELFERLNLTTHDPSGAVDRLARVLSFPTVSSLEAPNHVSDPEVFRQQLEFIQAAYPLVFQHLTTELVRASCAVQCIAELAVGHGSASAVHKWSQRCCTS